MNTQTKSPVGAAKAEFSTAFKMQKESDTKALSARGKAAHAVQTYCAAMLKVNNSHEFFTLETVAQNYSTGNAKLLASLSSNIKAEFGLTGEDKTKRIADSKNAGMEEAAIKAEITLIDNATKLAAAIGMLHMKHGTQCCVWDEDAKVWKVSVRALWPAITDKRLAPMDKQPKHILDNLLKVQRGRHYLSGLILKSTTEGNTMPNVEATYDNILKAGGMGAKAQRKPKPGGNATQGSASSNGSTGAASAVSTLTADKAAEFVLQRLARGGKDLTAMAGDWKDTSSVAATLVALVVDNYREAVTLALQEDAAKRKAAVEAAKARVLPKPVPPKPAAQAPAKPAEAAKPAAEAGEAAKPANGTSSDAGGTGGAPAKQAMAGGSMGQRR